MTQIVIEEQVPPPAPPTPRYTYPFKDYLIGSVFSTVVGIGLVAWIIPSKSVFHMSHGWYIPDMITVSLLVFVFSIIPTILTTSYVNYDKCPDILCRTEWKKQMKSYGYALLITAACSALFWLAIIGVVVAVVLIIGIIVLALI